MTEDQNDSRRQILKSREDRDPVILLQAESAAGDPDAFVIEAGSRCSWAAEGETLTPNKLRTRVEPWLTALCQSDHLSLLIGSGLTHAVHNIATGNTLPGMNAAEFVDFEFAKHIAKEVERSAKVTGRNEGNIEDQLRVANDLLRGLDVLGALDEQWQSKATLLRDGLGKIIKAFAGSILKGEQGIAKADDGTRDRAFNYLVTFLMSFASRSGTRDRLHIFTTNYDRLVETGADVAGLHLLDRFVGALTPVFRSSRLSLDIHYNPPGIRGEPRYLEGVARFTKLHGSIDWLDANGAIRRFGLPFGAKKIAPYLKAPGMVGADATRMMIYPNSAKDRETSGYPYVDLFRDFAAASCRPNHTLFTFGYSFGDEHINRVIEDMLTIPSTHLVVISYDDPLGRILATYEQIGRPAQISLLVGDHVGELSQLVDWYLPKPAIDRTTFRMATLLRARFGTEKPESVQASEEEDPNTGVEA